MTAGTKDGTKRVYFILFVNYNNFRSCLSYLAIVWYTGKINQIRLGFEINVQVEFTSKTLRLISKVGFLFDYIKIRGIFFYANDFFKPILECYNKKINSRVKVK